MRGGSGLRSGRMGSELLAAFYGVKKNHPYEPCLNCYTYPECNRYDYEIVHHFSFGGLQMKHLQSIACLTNRTSVPASTAFISVGSKGIMPTPSGVSRALHSRLGQRFGLPELLRGNHRHPHTLHSQASTFTDVIIGTQYHNMAHSTI